MLWGGSTVFLWHSCYTIILLHSESTFMLAAHERNHDLMKEDRMGSSYQAIVLELGTGSGTLRWPHWWKSWTFLEYLIQLMISGPGRKRVRKTFKEKWKLHLMAGRSQALRGNWKFQRHFKEQGLLRPWTQDRGTLYLREELNNRRHKNILMKLILGYESIINIWLLLKGVLCVSLYV